MKIKQRMKRRENATMENKTWWAKTEKLKKLNSEPRIYSQYILKIFVYKQNKYEYKLSLYMKLVEKVIKIYLESIFDVVTYIFYQYHEILITLTSLHLQSLELFSFKQWGYRFENSVYTQFYCAGYPCFSTFHLNTVHIYLIGFKSIGIPHQWNDCTYSLFWRIFGMLWSLNIAVLAEYLGDSNMLFFQYFNRITNMFLCSTVKTKNLSLHSSSCHHQTHWMTSDTNSLIFTTVSSTKILNFIFILR